MIYIPIIGFIYAAIKIMWAQKQLSLGLMTFDQESVYFHTFQVSMIVTVGTLVVVILALNVWARWAKRVKR